MALPNFVVIGAAKSGTTALAFYLRQHPEVFIPLMEEPSWFAFADQDLRFTAPDGRPPSENAYVITERSMYESLFDDASPGQIRGDISPAYLYWPGTAERLATEVPDARIVAVLRHPVDRAYSAFMHARREDREPMHDFRAALAAEPQRIADQCGLLWRYHDQSRYALQLQRWFDVFPRDQILLATYDEFRAGAGAFCRRVQAFIGVSDDFTPDTRIRHNVSGIPRSRFIYELLSSDSVMGRAVRAVTPSRSIESVKALQAKLRSRAVKPVPMDPHLRGELVDEWSAEVWDLMSLADLDLSHWLQRTSRSNTTSDNSHLRDNPLSGGA